MQKILIFLCSFLMVLFGFSCEQKDAQPEQPTEQSQDENIPRPEPGQQESPLLKESSLPSLQAGAIVKVGDQPISIGHTASPEVVDWNNDGKKDLLVGTYQVIPFEEGKVMLFLNEGTDQAPQFKEGEYLQAAGEIISVGAG